MVIRRFRNSFLSLMAKVHELSQEPYARPELAAEIQFELVRRIKYVEQRIRRWKARTATDETAWEAVEQYRRALALFRMIGDCIAFLYIDRWDVKQLAYGHDPGFISGKNGLAQELKILRLAATRKIPCLLADITNVLRHGDLYAFSPDRPPVICEIKSPSAPKDRRIKRQLERLENLSDFLTTDFSSKHYKHGNPTYRIGWSDSPTYHNVEALCLLSEGIQTGFAAREIEPGLCYAVVEPRRLNELDAIKQGIQTPAASLLNDGALSLDCYPYYPLLLSIPDPEHVFRLFTWNVLFWVFVDLKRMRSFYQERNIGFEFIPDEDDDYIVALKFPSNRTQFNHDRTVKVSRYFFGRICSEFLSLRDWLEQTVKMAEDSTLLPQKTMLSNPALYPIANSDG
jgi:hypothetical protein